MRKRSKYRPKSVLLNPIAYVIEGNQPIGKHDSYLVDLKVKNHLAMTQLLQGKATKADMNALIAMHNVSEALYRMGFGVEYGEYIVTGKAALLDLCGRGALTEKFICRAAEIQALNGLMELHDAQMEVITVRDMEKAIALAHKIIANRQAIVIKDTQ
jgi:hypothetical protein